MKTKLLIILSFMYSITTFASCNGFNEKVSAYNIKPDSTVYTTLGKTMSDIIFSPNKVTCYTIKGKSSVAKEDFELEPHYVRDSLVCKLKADQISILQFSLLASEENYKEDSIKVRSPYIPCVEFCFEKKKMQPLHVIVSLSDFSWTVVYDDKKQFNWNYSEKMLMERYVKMILGDAYNKIR